MEWLLAFGIGITGSLHCMGMCGPIVLLRRSERLNTLSDVIYHLGRILSYILLAMVFFIFGKSLNFFGIQQLISLIFGLLLIMASLFLFLEGKSMFSFIGFDRKWSAIIISRIQLLLKNPRPPSQFLVGALNGLLPCGLVYIAAITAISFDSSSQVALYMLFFGFGTMPSLLGLAVFREKLSPYFSKGKKWLGIGMMAVGVLMVLRGGNLGIAYLSPKLEQNADKPSCH